GIRVGHGCPSFYPNLLRIDILRRMTGPVKSATRSYDNAARQAQSDLTRGRILDAAQALIVAKGYRATTVAQIARDAGVHVDTLYALVGRKPEILRELIELAISGTDQPLAADERDYVQRMQAEPDPVRQLDIYAGAVRAIQARLAPLFLALRDAASTEPEAHDVWRQISERRAANMRRLVANLGHDALRPGLDIDAAADVVWATASSELFVLLTEERGWSLDRYQDWLADTWRRLLLGQA
ncbi:MAG: TetR/AcrR family transcriptional regulator, partial [Acidimicrobiales bacterium]|nr:TetR/AcrR family transcriptional regulator [Acidimicrobiales bacterium]